ncbi:MAG TPA: integrase core domain-containing protein [Bryobacteraceae bacterium]
MAAENPTWGEERIAEELRLKLQIRLSPRTVGKYVKRLPRPPGGKDQRWSTFLRNRGHQMVACNFFVSVTAGFRLVYVFVALEIGSRRLIHLNVTEHPTADWTLQQLRETLPGDQDYKFVFHHRHKTFSNCLDEEVESWGVQVLRTTVRMPIANAHCERPIGTIRRECLDHLIPLNAFHLRGTLREWARHYNAGRPHRSLGSGIPDQVQQAPAVFKQAAQPSSRSRVIAKRILGGLHHEYRWAEAA